MAEEVYGLSRRDVAILKEIIAKVNGLPADVSYPSRSHEEYEQYLTPEVFIAHIPIGGIRGAIDADPGSATCDIYRVLPSGNDLVKAGFTRKVYNVHPRRLSGLQFTPVVRDKFGSWLIHGCVECEDIDTGPGTSTAEWPPESTGTGTGTIGGPGVTGCPCFDIDPLPTVMTATLSEKTGTCDILPSSVQYNYIGMFSGACYWAPVDSRFPQLVGSFEGSPPCDALSLTSGTGSCGDVSSSLITCSCSPFSAIFILTYGPLCCVGMFRMTFTE